MRIAMYTRQPWPGFRHGLVTVSHVLVLVSLLAVQFYTAIASSSHMATMEGDEGYYAKYALSVFHGSRFTYQRSEEIVPLYPFWLAALMHIDPAFHDFLECAVVKKHLPAAQAEAICRPLGNIGYHAQAALGTIGIALVWIAGWIASRRLSVAHLSALIALAAGQYAVYTTSFMTEALVIPLFGGVNVCLAWLLVGGGTLRRNAIVATGCGITLGALILTRPPYEYLLPALLFAVSALIFRDRHRRRAHTVALACILGFASLSVAPWLAHNYRTNGFVGLTSDYSSKILGERLGYNEMSGQQWTAAFLYWTHEGDWKLLTRWFGQETLRYFDDSDERLRMMAKKARAELADSGVPKEDQLALLTTRIRDNLPKHLAVSVPLAWKGMQPEPTRWIRVIPQNTVPSIIPDPWFGIACWLLLIFSFVRGSPRNRGALVALAFCPVVILAINALVSLSIFRYNIGLVTPLSVGAALPIVWFIDSAWNRLRRWTPRMTLP